MSLPAVPNLEPITPPDPEAELNYSLAVIKDGIVYQVMNTDGQTAALFLSNPTFVQVDKEIVSIGHSYDSVSGTFSK